jgi:hypothetical protein
MEKEGLPSLLPGVELVNVIVASRPKKEVVLFPKFILVSQSKVIATLLGDNEDWKAAETQQQQKTFDMSTFCDDPVVNKSCLMFMMQIHNTALYMNMDVKPMKMASESFIPSLPWDYEIAGSKFNMMMKTCMYYQTDAACKQVAASAMAYVQDYIINGRCLVDKGHTVTFVANAEKELDKEDLFCWNEAVFRRLCDEISRSKSKSNEIEVPPSLSIVRFLSKNTLVNVLSYAPRISVGGHDECIQDEGDGYFGF